MAVTLHSVWSCYACKSTKRNKIVAGKTVITKCADCEAELSSSFRPDLKWWWFRRRLYDRRERAALERFYKRLLDA